VTPTQGKRLLAALAFTVVAVSACTGADAAISAGAAAPRGPAQSAPQPAPGDVQSATADQSIGAQILAAIKIAAAQPHGDVGDAATAQAP
jgi:hypothetical protein